MSGFKRKVIQGTRTNLVGIPSPIRKLLGIKTGDLVEWSIEDKIGKITFKKVEDKSGEIWKC